MVIVTRKARLVNIKFLDHPLAERFAALPRYSQAAFLARIREVFPLILLQNDMHPKSWTAFGGAYFYGKKRKLAEKV